MNVVVFKGFANLGQADVLDVCQEQSNDQQEIGCRNGDKTIEEWLVGGDIAAFRRSCHA